MSIRHWLLVFSIALTSACASTRDDASLEQIVTEEVFIDNSSGRPLTKTELNAVLVGNTYPLDDGGIYFHSEEIATIYRDGSSEETQWWQNGNSGFCHQTDISGGLEECISLFQHSTGDYLHDYEGTTRLVPKDSIFPGNIYD